MKLNEWIRRLYWTEQEVISGKRKLKIKPTIISIIIFLFIFLLCKALFGKTQIDPDTSNYKTLANETISKEGEVVLKMGSLELKKSHPSEKQTQSSSQVSFDSNQGQVISRKERSKNEYVLPAGTKISVTLEGDLNSQLNQSPVIANVNQSFSFNGKVLVPAGSKILGKAGEESEEGRISVQFDQLVYPSGVQVSAQSAAMMEDGSPGVVGDYHSGRWGRYAGSLALSFTSGVAAALETTQANAFGYDQPEASTRNAVLNGLARSTLDQGKRLGEETQNKKGFVTIPSGKPFVTYFESEVDLSGVLQ